MSSRSASRMYRQYHSVYRIEDRAVQVEAQPVIDALVVDSAASELAVAGAPVVGSAASVRVVVAVPVVDNAALGQTVASGVVVVVVVVVVKAARALVVAAPAAASIMACVINSSFRRSMMSARAPAGTPSMNTGSVVAV